jgi:hypothetical protein
VTLPAFLVALHLLLLLTNDQQQVTCQTTPPVNLSSSSSSPTPVLLAGSSNPAVSQAVRSIDYRCDNRRFLVVRAQLSSPNPNFSKPRTRTANSDFWS